MLLLTYTPPSASSLLPCSVPVFLVSLILPLFPVLWGRYIFYIFWQQLPLATPKAQSKVGPLFKSLLPVCAVYPLSDSPWGGFPGRDLFPWRYAFSHVATVQHVHSLGSLWKDFIQIKPASGQQKSAAGKGVCCQD